MNPAYQFLLMKPLILLSSWCQKNPVFLKTKVNGSKGILGLKKHCSGLVTVIYAHIMIKGDYGFCLIIFFGVWNGLLCLLNCQRYIIQQLFVEPSDVTLFGSHQIIVLLLPQGKWLCWHYEIQCKANVILKGAVILLLYGILSLHCRKIHL